MDQFFVIFQQLLVFAFFAFVGAQCVKLKILNEPALNSMSKFIINVTMPAMLICNLLSGPSLADLMGSLPIFGVYLGGFVFLYLFNCVTVRFLHIEAQKVNIYKALSTFANAGFIGIPLIIAIFGKEGGVYMSLTTIVDQLLLWTLGIKLTSNASKLDLACLRNFVSPALISIVLSLIGVVVGFTLPKPVYMALSPIGSMTPVLSMIYLGGLFCVSDVKKYLKSLDIYMLVFFKMLIFPAVLWTILKFLPVSGNIAQTVVLLLALPSMTSIAMFAQKYDNQPEYAVATVLMSTALSIITVPLVSVFVACF